MKINIITLIFIWISAIRHYNRMIKWAEEQTPDNIRHMGTMERILGEDWSGEYCSYCEKYTYVDDGGIIVCPNVCILKPDLGGCCDNLWFNMSTSQTWGEWVVNAKQVRRYIIKNGLRERSLI